MNNILTSHLPSPTEKPSGQASQAVLQRRVTHCLDWGKRCVKQTHPVLSCARDSGVTNIVFKKPTPPPSRAPMTLADVQKRAAATAAAATVYMYQKRGQHRRPRINAPKTHNVCPISPTVVNGDPGIVCAFQAVPAQPCVGCCQCTHVWAAISGFGNVMMLWGYNGSKMGLKIGISPVAAYSICIADQTSKFHKTVLGRSSLAVTIPSGYNRQQVFGGKKREKKGNMHSSAGVFRDTYRAGFIWEVYPGLTWCISVSRISIPAHAAFFLGKSIPNCSPTPTPPRLPIPPAPFLRQPPACPAPDPPPPPPPPPPPCRFRGPCACAGGCQCAGGRAA